MKSLTKCPVCDSARLAVAFSAPTTRGMDQRAWPVTECTGCGHQFINPQPSWEELEPYYSSAYDAYDPMHGSDTADDLAVEEAQRTGEIRHIPVPAGLRLLDVGCGAGWFLRICKRLGAIAQGVEPSAHGAATAQQSGLSVFNGALEDYIAQAPGGTRFDVITANHVVEHLPDPVKTLRAMRGLLADGGYLWIAVPNAAYPICRALKGRWHSSDLPYHLMHFTPSSIVEAGRRAGLKVRRQTTESLVPQVAASIGLLLRYRCFIPRRVTQRFGGALDSAAGWYARRIDARGNGEALLTEFIAD